MSEDDAKPLDKTTQKDIANDLLSQFLGHPTRSLNQYCCEASQLLKEHVTSCERNCSEFCFPSQLVVQWFSGFVDALKVSCQPSPASAIAFIAPAPITEEPLPPASDNDNDEGDRPSDERDHTWAKRT
ncbi:hypothetical protein PG999_012376 [Apiospora kogelbergensis]|uniref:Uncharacterized protein n=1 Tax=Apiospora kogelbergensis TaxID=1337665 RepID=A0AAW0QGY4_9PEZI